MASGADLLDSWIATRAAPDALEWLSRKVERAAVDGADASFFLAFSTAPRRLGRANLVLSAAELADARDARRGFDPTLWTVDQSARVRLVLSLPSTDVVAYRRTLDGLFEDGDLGELVALYQGLPLLPHPHLHRARAAEGIRSNMKAVFEAVALRNPYPAEQLDDGAFHQLVLKCLFVGSALYRVDGLDGRVTLDLAKMLSDFAHERWAAKRPVSPELWRGVGPVADGHLLADLERAVATGTDVDRAAVALAARHNPNAEPILAVHSFAFDRALATYPTWEAVARAKMAAPEP